MNADQTSRIDALLGHIARRQPIRETLIDAHYELAAQVERLENLTGQHVLLSVNLSGNTAIQAACGDTYPTTFWSSYRGRFVRSVYLSADDGQMLRAPYLSVEMDVEPDHDLAAENAPGESANSHRYDDTGSTFHHFYVMGTFAHNRAVRV